MVNIEMANGKNIKIELYPDVAPITVANFEKLCSGHGNDLSVFR